MPSLMDLMRRVLLIRNDAVSDVAAVTRRELGLRSRKERAANTARQRRRASRALMRARRHPEHR
jgi:hypothetical protein